MVKNREGYHTLVVQIPEVVWSALRSGAYAKDVSATKLLTEILQKHFKIDKTEMPKPLPRGRKPFREK